MISIQITDIFTVFNPRIDTIYQIEGILPGAVYLGI
jgi:hypothetical protein